MNYQTAQFEFAAGKKEQLPVSDLPEIVFSGKSNVGKSSLINKLLNRKALARVSSVPGKTVTINSYKLDECRFIDLPGYGFAKVSQAEKARWSGLVEGYFNSGRNIKLVVQILDARHEPSGEDYDMINYLIEREIPFVVACTKIDKLNKTQLGARTERFAGILDEHEIGFVMFSSLKGNGVDELKGMIESAAQG